MKVFPASSASLLSESLYFTQTSPRQAFSQPHLLLPSTVSLSETQSAQNSNKRIHFKSAKSTQTPGRHPHGGRAPGRYCPMAPSPPDGFEPVAGAVATGTAAAPE